MAFCLPENIKSVLCYQGAANAVACDVINCEQATWSYGKELKQVGRVSLVST